MPKSFYDFNEREDYTFFVISFVIFYISLSMGILTFCSGFDGMWFKMVVSALCCLGLV